MPWYLKESLMVRMRSQHGHMYSNRNSIKKSKTTIVDQIRKSFKYDPKLQRSNTRSRSKLYIQAKCSFHIGAERLTKLMQKQMRRKNTIKCKTCPIMKMYKEGSIITTHVHKRIPRCPDSDKHKTN